MRDIRNREGQQIDETRNGQPIRVQTKPRRFKDGSYDYNGWTINPRGGYTMIRHFTAEKNDKWHWAFRLRDCVAFCDDADAGRPIASLHIKALYL